jgi:hypothetical protein
VLYKVGKGYSTDALPYFHNAMIAQPGNIEVIKIMIKLFELTDQPQGAAQLTEYLKKVEEANLKAASK